MTLLIASVEASADLAQRALEEANPQQKAAIEAYLIAANAVVMALKGGGIGETPSQEI